MKLRSWLKVRREDVYLYSSARLEAAFLMPPQAEEEVLEWRGEMPPPGICSLDCGGITQALQILFYDLDECWVGREPCLRSHL